MFVSLCACVSGGGRCVPRALADLLWRGSLSKSLLLDVTATHLFCVLLWAKLLWKLWLKGSYQSRIWRESFREELTFKWNKGQVGFAGKREGSGDGKGRNLRKGSSACAHNWGEREQGLLSNLQRLSVCVNARVSVSVHMYECVCVYECVHMRMCEYIFGGVLGAWRLAKGEAGEPYLVPTCWCLWFQLSVHRSVTFPPNTAATQWTKEALGPAPNSQSLFSVTFRPLLPALVLKSDRPPTHFESKVWSLLAPQSSRVCPSSLGQCVPAPCRSLPPEFCPRLTDYLWNWNRLIPTCANLLNIFIWEVPLLNLKKKCIEQLFYHSSK